MRDKLVSCNVYFNKKKREKERWKNKKERKCQRWISFQGALKLLSGRGPKLAPSTTFGKWILLYFLPHFRPVIVVKKKMIKG